MDLVYLKKLVRILEHSGLDEIEIEEEGTRIRVARNSHNSISTSPGGSQAAQIHASSGPHWGPAPGGAQTEVAPPPAAAPKQPEANYHEIKSPIVGTFYRAPAPDADPYVEVGQIVQPKMVLCIIEAMKLMNEIESDVGGRIVKILVENGQPVEYNQTLFLIEPV